MSYSTTCNTYFVDTFDQVTSNSTTSASCDSSYVDCSVGSSAGTINIVCDSTLQTTPIGADFSASEYFCVCDGGVTLSVPSIVNCATFCSDLSTPETCNFITLYDGATQGNADQTVIGDDCDKYGCDSSGVLCTTNGYTSYECDNTEHELPGPDAAKSYVCNCAGPAAVPEQYQGGGQTVGTACGNAGQVTATTTTASSISAATSNVASSGEGGGSSSGGSSSGGGSSSNPATKVSLRKGLLGGCILLMLGMKVWW